MRNEEKLQHFMQIENLQELLDLLNSLSVELVERNTETIKTALMFILFKKRVSTEITISGLGLERLNRVEWKNFSTATVKEFKQHIVESIFISMYADAVAIKTIEDFDQFLEKSKDEISKSFRTSGGNFIKSIHYVLEYP